jgi:FkbM family methyltransferase
MNPRNLAERISRGVVLRRRLPRHFHRLPLYVSPEAGLRFWRNDMRKVDPMLFRMLEELVKPGSVVWDIGANVGLFTFGSAALAGVNGFVLAIEPDIWLAHLLVRSTTSVQREPVRVAAVSILCAAVSYQHGVAALEIAERARASNHLSNSKGSSQTGGRRYEQQTLTITLDALLDHFPAPSVVKIDVETAEVGVIKGASKLLSSARPAIWCEVAADNSDAITELLHNHGYEMYSAGTPPAQRIPLARAPWDTLALPLLGR